MIERYHALYSFLSISFLLAKYRILKLQHLDAPDSLMQRLESFPYD